MNQPITQGKAETAFARCYSLAVKPLGDALAGYGFRRTNFHCRDCATKFVYVR